VLDKHRGAAEVADADSQAARVGLYLDSACARAVPLQLTEKPDGQDQPYLGVHTFRRNLVQARGNSLLGGGVAAARRSRSRAKQLRYQGALGLVFVSISCRVRGIDDS
jgi:hypothetical protein